MKATRSFRQALQGIAFRRWKAEERSRIVVGRVSLSLDSTALPRLLPSEYLRFEDLDGGVRI